MTAAHTEDGRAKFSIKGGTKLADFIMSDRDVDVIEGPLGSGKTRALCLRVMRHVQEQWPSPLDGMRYTRFAIVRNTQPDLKRTTIRSWLEVVPEGTHGRFNYGQVLQHKLSWGDIRSEIDFVALDKDEDVRRLRSTEYTGIVFNELPFIPKMLFDEATSRLRYPPPEHGGPKWRGVFADANAPDEDHWLGMMTGQVDLPPNLTEEERQQFDWPPHWGFHLQPPALIENLDHQGRIVGYRVNPNAENIENLPADYYAKQITGKSKAWIDSRLMVRIALVVDGSPVWPMFRVETHVSPEPLRPVAGHDVVVGLDFGRSPAAIFGQAINNRALVQYELLGMNEGAVTFAPKVKRFLAEHYPDFKVRLYGDPKGQDKGQADERTAYDIFRSHGIPVIPAPGLKQNMISTRVDAVAHLLNDMYDGRPRFALSPLCRTTKVAMAGRYHNERDEQGELRPCKDRYSNPADALQYWSLGLGEGRRMIGLGAIGDVKAIKVYHGRRSLRRVSA